MGTNFRWKPNDEGQLPAGMGEAPLSADDPSMHIGKRCAAGLYCWDCGVPCVEAVQGRRVDVMIIHGSGAKRLDSCPECGEAHTPSTLSEPGNPAGVELGFAKPYPGRPTGVRGASSFGWAQEPGRVIQICMRWPDEVLAEDEYGEQLTGGQLLEIITGCPLWFTDSVGIYFS